MQTNTKTIQELRDSITRKMYECGYDQLSDTSKSIVDKRVEEVRPRTSHDLAVALQKSADWLLSRDAFGIETFWARASLYMMFSNKEMFIAAARAIGSGKKEFDNFGNIGFRSPIPGGEIHISAPRNTVCRLIRPAEYECDPFLSPEEENELENK